jgi:uncharacterized protein YbcC (UPF0753/DUF2309 family)
VGRERTPVRQLVDRAARYLPAQGPITSFIHHNTLHAFEDLPFETAVETAAGLYGCQPYLSEERYREELELGRIRSSDLELVLREELGPRSEEAVGGIVSRIDLRSTMLKDPVRLASEAELQWVIAVGGGARRFRRRCPPLIREQVVADTRQWVMRDLRGEREADTRLRGIALDIFARWGEERIEHWSRATWEQAALTLQWRLCRGGMHGLPNPHAAWRPARLRDALLAATGEDADALVHETLIRFCAAFADQGLAAWPLPRRGEGFYRAFLALYGPGYPVRERWMKRLPDEIARLERESIGAEQSIEESLAAFGLADDERQTFVTESLLALRGWAGMLRQLESRADRVRLAAPPGTLVEFFAVRLILDRLAAAHVAEEIFGRADSLAALRPRLAAHRPAPRAARDLTATQRAYVLFLLAQSLGWTPRRLARLTKHEWEELAQEIECFSGLDRRRIFQLAYERRYHIQALDALSAHHRPDRDGAASRLPTLQAICCIDEREESLRRHLEEIDPGVETFGAAGFFGVAMYYRGARDAGDAPLCPVALRPAFRIRERVVDGDAPRHARSRSWMRRLEAATQRVDTGGGSIAGGLLAALLGSVAAVPLVARVLFPRLATRLRRRAGALVRHPVRTELVLDRDARATPGGESPAVPEGLLPAEMAAIVEGLLREVGLTRGFSRLVVVVGHGSTSLNNPHESAHDCGACGGGRGGPNARAFAQMANDPRVRALLAAAGVRIPADTAFLAAYHDTCDDSVEFYDTGRLPLTHVVAYRHARDTIERACERNAHERCRRFRSAGLLISTREARRHVEARAQDLAQPRPEFGHATNAICVVGRRARTRGLFLDRRAFLVSYDPAADGDGAILLRILQAVVPVCAGISLEYYFSYVDPVGWGCGTKLPHNIVSLLGVMDGSASDLRPGLPWQMVEIHDPLRLLLVVEAAPATLAAVLERDAQLARLCRNRWIRLAALDPDSSRIHVHDGDGFRAYEPETDSLPQAPSSSRWYTGLREHLEFSAIRPPAALPVTRSSRP